MSNIDPFLAYGNLAYFPKGDITTQYFFYFKTLLTNYSKLDYEPYRTKYINQAHAIGNAAVSYLNGSGITDKDEEGQSRMKEIMNLTLTKLQQAIQYERANENKYIKSKLKEFNNNEILEKTDPEYKKKKEILENLLLKINNGESVDYYSLINIINILNQGIENTVSIYQYNRKQIEDLKTAINTARTNYADQIDGLDKSGKNKSRKRRGRPTREKEFTKQAELLYLKKGTIKTTRPKNQIQRFLNAHLKKIRSVDSIIAETLTTAIREILESPEIYRTIVEKLIENSATDRVITGSKLLEKSNESEIRHIIIEAAMKITKNRVAAILKGEINYEQLASEITDYIDQTTSNQTFEMRINGFYENFGVLGKKLSYFKDGERRAKGLYDAAKELYTAILNKTSNLQQLDAAELFLLKRQGKKLQPSEFGNDFYKIIEFISKMEKIANELRKQQEIQEQDETERIDPRVTATLGDDATFTFSIDSKGVLHISGDKKISELTIIQKTMGFNNFNPKTLTGLVSTLKRQASQMIKDKITEAIQNGLEIDAEDTIQRGLENIRVSIGGPKWSEIIVQVQESLRSGKIWTGPLNLKDDNIIIKCSCNSSDLKFEFSKNTIENISKTAMSILTSLEDEYIRELTIATQEDLKDFSKRKQYGRYKEYAERYYGDNGQNSVRQRYLEQTTSIISQLEKELEKLIKSGKEKTEKFYEIENKLKAHQRFLEEIKGTLFIGSTSKTYSTYQNHIGFIGGSLGSNIIIQINRLNELFSEAGISLSQDEVNWLINAAINNSSLSVVGKSNETTIESILGSMAVFSLFTESGIELEQFNTRIDTQIPDDPNIMHLYFLNGTYYPGSFLLQEAYNRVQKICDAIEKETLTSIGRYERGIVITNNVNFGDIPNNEGYKKKNSSHVTDPWQRVSLTARAKTRIHVLFLAGMLDIIDELVKNLQEVKVPVS